MRVGVAVSAVALAGVALLAAGLTAGVVLAPDRAAATSGSAADPSVPVTSRSFEDSQQVAFTPVLGTAAQLTVDETGRVTRTACKPGVVIASGSSPVTVGDRRVVALATSVPLWRDLKVGVKGADVEALQRELVRLGYRTAVDGAYGWDTAAAVKALLTHVGTHTSDGSLPVASVMWLPARSVRVGACAVPLGGTTGSGAFATTAGGLTALRVSGDVSGLAAGARVVRFGDLSAPVSADGAVTDAKLLAAIAASPLLTANGADQGQVTLEYALAQPLQVSVVPPGSLAGLSGDAGCVTSGGAVHAVRVVASQLGQTMVVFPGGDAPAGVDLTPATSSCS